MWGVCGSDGLTVVGRWIDSDTLTLILLLPILSSQVEVELTTLCQSVLEDFNLVLFYLPAQTLGGSRHSHSEEEELQPQQQQQHHVDSCSTVLPDTLIFKMVVICLMVVHSLKRGG